MAIAIRGLETERVERLRRGGPDANGHAPLLREAEGPANPCRHCLELIAEGEQKLVLSHRPFDSLQPYAECGPIFLHAAPCERYVGSTMPKWFEFLDPAVVRGYGADDWIRYDTGAVVRGSELGEICAGILEDETIAYVHIRSKFGCYQCRVDRA